jgi:hypothetical protein
MVFLSDRPQKPFRQERCGSLLRFLFLIVDRMSFREHALVKDTRDKYAAAFSAVEYDVLAVFKTI